MSHELRTPFSSFYGLLDILDGTDMNPGQREIGKSPSYLHSSFQRLTRRLDSRHGEAVVRAFAQGNVAQGIPRLL